MMYRRLVAVCFITVLALSSSPSAVAYSGENSSMLIGSVIHDSNAIPGAEITVTNLDNDLLAVVFTDDSGEFSIDLSILETTSNDMIWIDAHFVDSNGDNQFVSTCRIYWGNQISATLEPSSDSYDIGRVGYVNADEGAAWNTFDLVTELDDNSGQIFYPGIIEPGVSALIHVDYFWNVELKVECDHKITTQATFLLEVFDYQTEQTVNRSTFSYSNQSGGIFCGSDESNQPNTFTPMIDKSDPPLVLGIDPPFSQFIGAKTYYVATSISFESASFVASTDENYNDIWLQADVDPKHEMYEDCDTITNCAVSITVTWGLDGI